MFPKLVFWFIHQPAVSLLHVSWLPECCDLCRPWQNQVAAPGAWGPEPTSWWLQSSFTRLIQDNVTVSTMQVLQPFLINIVIPGVIMTPIIYSWLITCQAPYMNPSSKSSQWLYRRHTILSLSLRMRIQRLSQINNFFKNQTLMWPPKVAHETHWPYSARRALLGYAHLSRHDVTQLTLIYKGLVNAFEHLLRTQYTGTTDRNMSKYPFSLTPFPVSSNFQHLLPILTLSQNPASSF